MEKQPHYHFSWIHSFQKTEIPYISEMIPLETEKSGGKLLPQTDLRGEVFLEEISCRRYNKKECKVEVNSVKNTTINIWLNDGVY